MNSDRLAALSLTDLAVVVAEYTRDCQDQGQTDGHKERCATLAVLRTELRQRVLVVASRGTSKPNAAPTSTTNKPHESLQKTRTAA